MTRPTRVFLCDDVPEIRELIRYGLEKDPEIRVVGEAGDGEEAVARVGEARPDVVLIDLSMPCLDGLEAIPRIKDAVPDVAIVVLSGFAASRMEQSARDCGADLYVEKGASSDRIRTVTREAAALR